MESGPLIPVVVVSGPVLQVLLRCLGFAEHNTDSNNRCTAIFYFRANDSKTRRVLVQTEYLIIKNDGESPNRSAVLL